MALVFMTSHRIKKIKDVQMGNLNQEIICSYCEKKIYAEEPVALVIYESGSPDKNVTDIHCVDCLQEELNMTMHRIDNWAAREKDKMMEYNAKFESYRDSDLKKKLDIVRNLQDNKKKEDD
jgi:hypothetical protein